MPSFPYESLWHERSVPSVANLARKDAEEFLPLGAPAKPRTETTLYPLSGANRALANIRTGIPAGAAVLVP